MILLEAYFIKFKISSVCLCCTDTVTLKWTRGKYLKIHMTLVSVMRVGHLCRMRVGHISDTIQLHDRSVRAT